LTFFDKKINQKINSTKILTQDPPLITSVLNGLTVMKKLNVTILNNVI